MSNSKAVKKSVTLYPMDWDYVTRIENKYQCTTSQAVRLLVQAAKDGCVELPREKTEVKTV